MRRRALRAWLTARDCVDQADHLRMLSQILAADARRATA